MIRVRIDAGPPLVRASLAQGLNGAEDIEVVPSTVVSRGPQVDNGRQEDPDVVIVILDDDNDWETVLDRAGDAEVILLVDDPSGLEWEEGLRNGVRGVLPQDVQPDVLLAAVKAISMGLSVFSSNVADLLAPFRRSAAASFDLPESLTTREKEVLELLAEGLPNKGIAERLAISDHTVKFHLSSIFGKLGASSRTEAVTAAIRQGIIMV